MGEVGATKFDPSIESGRADITSATIFDWPKILAILSVVDIDPTSRSVERTIAGFARWSHAVESVSAIFDTSKNEYTIYDIPIKPAEEVFNLEQIEKNRETGEINDKIREYVDLLGGNSEMREWNFVSNLDEFILVNGVRQEVQDIIKLALEVE